MLSTSLRHLVLPLCLALATFACKKDEGKDGKDDKSGESKDGEAGKTTEPGSADGKTKKVAEAPAGGMGTAISGSSDALASRLPGSVAVVMGLSLDRARQTAAYKQYQSFIAGELDEPITDIRKACNLELTSVPGSLTVTVAGFDGAAKDDVSMLLETSWGRAKIEDCLHKISEMKEGAAGKIKVENDGKITRYSSKADKNVLNVAWLSDTAVLLHTNFENDKVVAGVANGTSVLKNDKNMSELLSTVDRSGVFWVIGSIPADGKKQLSKLVSNADPLGFYASLDLKDDAKAVIGVRFADADSASRVATAAKGLLEMAKARPEVKQFAALLDNVQLTSKGNDFVATSSLTAAQVQQLSSMAAGELGLPKPSK